MKVNQVMTENVRRIQPDQTLREAAALMREAGSGSIVVYENDRMVGMITDHDIAVRAIAEGLGCDAKVRAIMSPNIKYCFDDEEVENVARNMATIQMRRLPVVNRDKRLVGVVSMGDIAHAADKSAINDMVRGLTS